MPHTLEFVFLGTFDIRSDGQPLANFRSLKAQALLCYLAETERGHSRNALSGLLWGDSPDDNARASLRQTLSNLTELCADHLIITRQSIAFDRRRSSWLDTRQFEAAAARVIAAPERENVEPDLNLYRGEFLHGFYVRNAPDFETWMLGVRGHYRELALRAFDAVASYGMAQGDMAQTIRYSRRVLELDPWHEGAHRQLMQSLAQTGQRTAALEQYRAYRQVLLDELGIEPDEATQKLYEEIKRASSPVSARPTPPSPAHHADQEQVATPAAPFAGRARELKQLASAFAQARAGRGQIRFVTGGAGQGKSTLVQEFVRRAQAIDAEVLALTGYCNAYTGTGDPYLPFREVLTLLAGDEETLDPAQRSSLENAHRLRAALPKTLAALVKYAPDLIGPFISAQQLLDRAARVAATDAPWYQQLAAWNTTENLPLEGRRLLSQFGAALKAIAKEQPLVIVLEDLHWMDAASSELLSHLSRVLGESRLLIVGTYRADEVALGVAAPAGAAHPLASLLSEFKQRHGAIWLELDTLSAAEGQQFVEEYLDMEPNQLDTSFRAALSQHTGGHALFTAELLHAMQLRGDLHRDNQGRWVAAGAIDWHQLPVRVEGVLEKQLANMDRQTQAMLRVACVQGENFVAEVIAQVLGLGEPIVVQHLSQELARKHRVVSSQDFVWLGQHRLSRYSFRHYLFQHYLYQQLDETERAYLHEAVGLALEQLYGEQSEQIATQLAYHFQHAGRLEKTVTALLLAGQRAQQFAAHKEAHQHLTHGLALLRALPSGVQRDEQELDYLIALAQTLDTAGHVNQTEIAELLLRARTLCHQLGETKKIWPVLYGLYMTHFYRGEYLQAHGYIERQISLIEPNIEQRMIVYSLLGGAAISFGQFSDSIAYLEEALTLYDSIEQRGMETSYTHYDVKNEILVSLAQAKWFMGYPDQAKRYNEAALQTAKARERPFALAQGLLHMTWQLELQREFAQTRAFAATLIPLATEHDFHIFLSHAYIYDGSAMSEEGQPEAGLARLLEGIAQLRASGTLMAQSHFAHLQARGYRAVGQIQKGLEVIEAALATVDQSGEHWFDAELLRLKGELLQIQGASPAIVQGYFEQAIAIARRQQAKMWELRATVSLCQLWRAQGRSAAAHARLAAIYHWFTEALESPDLQDARSLLAALSPNQP